jgi:hypothetical protein
MLGRFRVSLFIKAHWAQVETQIRSQMLPSLYLPYTVQNRTVYGLLASVLLPYT